MKPTPNSPLDAVNTALKATQAANEMLRIAAMSLNTAPRERCLQYAHTTSAAIILLRGALALEELDPDEWVSTDHAEAIKEICNYVKD